MKKIPFNFNDARNGRDIYVGEMQAVKLLFIGLDGSGNVITEDDFGRLRRYFQSDIFHLPKTVTKYVNLYYNKNTKDISLQCQNFGDYETAVYYKIYDSENIKYLKTVDVEIEEDY